MLKWHCDNIMAKGSQFTKWDVVLEHIKYGISILLPACSTRFSFLARDLTLGKYLKECNIGCQRLEFKEKLNICMGEVVLRNKQRCSVSI